MSEQQQKQTSSRKSILHQTFIQEETAPLPIRLLKKVDIFSFIPVPKDDPVSTKQSLIGTGLFFTIFFTYIIIDFYKFVTNNPPNAQNYYTKIDGGISYELPRFAITFMDGQLLNKTQDWNTYFNFSLSQEWKDKGSQNKPPVNMSFNKFYPQNQTYIQDQIQWIDDQTKKFYSILRTPTQPMNASGLLYSSSNASYAKVKVQMCNVNANSSDCQNITDIQRKCGQGRIFLFIQMKPDTTDFGSAERDNDNKYLIYNFFLMPYVYKRVTFNFRVVNTVVKPDYFYRFFKQQQTRLEIQSFIEQNSNVTQNAKDQQVQLNMLGINFQLAPQVLNVRVTYSSLIDHISMWGAFWGVLFAIFAIIFLSYNRKKFYTKNPEWNKFKKQIDFNQTQQN